MRKIPFLTALGALIILLAGCGSGSTDDEAAGSPLAGETIDFVVPYEPGGGFDFYVRLIAPYLADELGARIVVRNEPAAGGIAATNKTWAAEPDGTRIQLADTPGAILNELSGQGGARYEVANFSWLGRVAGEPEIVTTTEAGDVDQFEDLAELSDIRFASVGVYDADSIGAQLVAEILDKEVTTVTGFEGAPEAFAAVLRGEVQAFNVSAGSSKEYADTGEGIALATLDTESSEILPDAPPLTDFVESEEDKELIEIHGTLVSVGRSIMGPPDMPQEIVDAYREALDKVLQDPEVVQKAEDQERIIQYLPGAEVQSMIQDVAGDPSDAYLELITRAGEMAAE